VCVRSLRRHGLGSIRCVRTAISALLLTKPIPGKDRPIVGAPPPDLESEPEAEPNTARMVSNLVPIAAIAPQAPPQRTLPPEPFRRSSPALNSPPAPAQQASPRKSEAPPRPRTASMQDAPAPKPQSLPSRASQNMPASRGSIAERISPLPPPTRPVRRVMASVDEELEVLPISTTPRRLGGWIVAVVLIGGMLVFGAWTGRSVLEKGVRASSAVAPLDPRAQQFLAAGDAALLQGDLDGAKESYDKASGVADKDPRVLLPEARLATIRADVPWLKQRLLAPAGVDVPASAQADITANKAQLDDLAAKAKKAADDAVAAAPDDPSALRVKVDALRIAGDRQAARALVGRVATNASQSSIRRGRSCSSGCERLLQVRLGSVVRERRSPMRSRGLAIFRRRARSSIVWRRSFIHRRSPVSSAFTSKACSRA